MASLMALALVSCASSSDPSGDTSDAGSRPDAGHVEPGNGDPPPEVVVGRYDGGPGGDKDAAPGPRSIVINEVDYDQVGTDTGEFVEIYNPTSAAVDLTNLTVVFVAGSTKAEYLRVDLSGSLAPGKYLVVASSTVNVAAGATKVLFPAASNNMRNGGPNGVGILDKSTSKLVDALSYGGPLLAATVNGVTGSLDFVEGTAATAIDSNTEQGSLARLPNGTDTDDADSDWNFTSTATPGGPNVP
jgi:hypothetical protein